VMSSMFAFLVAIFLVNFFSLKMKIQPFMCLLVSALVYGCLTGMGPELIGHITTGMACLFSTLAIIIFSGSVIAEYLRDTCAVNRVVADLALLTRKRTMLASGFAGYLVSLPAMCCITSYLILEPVVKGLGEKAEGSGTRAQFAAAISSVVSFNLVYPSPVMIALTNAFDVPPVKALKIGVPLSLLILGMVLVYMRHIPLKDANIPVHEGPLPSRARSWTPLALPIFLILLGLLVPRAWFVGNVNVALFIGALLSVALSGSKSQEVMRRASTRAGIIIFDLCGAGAFGYVIGQSDLCEELTILLGPNVPVVVLPFLVAATLQLAQGSRVVTVVITAEIMKGYPLDGIEMIFLISAGAFVFSYVSDPYFWLVNKTTGGDLKETFRGYTVPLTLCGLVVFAAATFHLML